MAIPDPLGFGSFPVTVKASEIVQLAKRTDEWYSNRSIKRLTHYVERDKQSAKAQKEPAAQPISHKDFLTDEEITGATIIRRLARGGEPEEHFQERVCREREAQSRRDGPEGLPLPAGARLTGEISSDKPAGESTQMCCIVDGEEGQQPH